MIKPIERMVSYIYKYTNIALATSNSFVKEIQNRMDDKRDLDKVKYYPQYAEDFYKPLGKHIDEYKYSDKDIIFRICFTGNIGKTQGLEILAEVAKQIKNDYLREKQAFRYRICNRW